MDVTDKSSAMQMINQLMSQYNLNNKDVIQRGISTINRNISNITIQTINVETAIKIMLKFAYDNAEQSSYNQSQSFRRYLDNEILPNSSHKNRLDNGVLVVGLHNDLRYLNPHYFSGHIYSSSKERHQVGLASENDRGVSFIPQNNSSARAILKAYDPYYNSYTDGGMLGNGNYKIYKDSISGWSHAFWPIFTVYDS